METLPEKTERSMQHMEPDDLPALVFRYLQEEVVGKSSHTLYARKLDLSIFCLFYQNLNRHLRVKEFMPRDVKLFQNELQDRYAGNSVNRRIGSVRAFSTWLLSNGFTRIHACRGIKDLQVDLGPPKAPRDREYHRFRKVADGLAQTQRYEFSQDFRNLVLLETLNASGLRITELLSTTCENYFNRKFHDIRCKGGKIRSLSIKTEVCTLINEYIEHHRTKGSNFLFTSKSGERLDRVSAWKALKRIARFASANLPSEESLDLTCHSLRHRHGFKCREAKDPVWAATRLGHSSLNYVQRYSQETPQEERELLEKIE
jgi:site-specific recombinase XerD